MSTLEQYAAENTRIMQTNQTPRIGFMSEDAASVKRWAEQARKLWSVPVRVFMRSVRCGGVNTALYVAVLWPKGTQKP